MQDIPDLLETLRRSPNILSQFVRSIPESRLNLRRGEGFWTVAEHCSHLAQVQPMLLKRIERFMNEDKPEFVPYNPGGSTEEPDTPPRRNIESVLGQFTRDRASQFLLLECADENSWKKAGDTPGI